MEFSYVAEKDTENNYLTSFEKIKEHCKDCKKKNFV